MHSLYVKFFKLLHKDITAQARGAKMQMKHTSAVMFYCLTEMTQIAFA